jgi:molybdopterin molybdotransferase
MLAAGGTCDAIKIALRPGKPIACGALRDMRVLSLPGNPVAALVNFMLFARPLIRKLSGITRVGVDHGPGRASETFFHKAGRTEFVPVSISGYDNFGLPLLRKLGRGGSARLMPLMEADGFAELQPDVGDIEAGVPLRFYPFAFDTIL